MTPTEAVERLAEELFEHEELLAPNGETWDTLEDCDKEHYRSLVRALLKWRNLLLIAIG